MKFAIEMTNELPFMLELPKGVYRVKTSSEVIDLTINSDMYKLHTARFPQFSCGNMYIGESDELQKTISEKNIANYAFAECKTFVSCVFTSEADFCETDYLSVTKEQCVSQVSTNLLHNNVPYEDSNDLKEKSESHFATMKTDDVTRLKEVILIEREFSKLNNFHLYCEALNQLIHQYLYLRKLFWVHKVDENVLDGTLTQYFLNGKYYNSITRGGLAPSISPFKKIFPEISDDEKKTLDERLMNRYIIPIEEELILVARSLWYRLEYRSAIIEASAALEVMVEKKLVEKMKSQGLSDSDIDIELKETEVKFRKRCDVYLKEYTGKSFIHDNPILWNTIDQHRTNYRNKIAHSDINPNRRITESIISDFEQAIVYVRSL